jgi:hypothetical protein
MMNIKDDAILEKKNGSLKGLTKNVIQEEIK